MIADVVKHGIIGCGRVAPNHASGMRQSNLGEVAWACDRDPRVLAEFADRYRIRRRTIDYREMLADSDLVSVSIAVDHAQHAKLTRDALLAGKHVLVEKPLALSLRDAHELIGLAAERNLCLVTVAQHRFDALFTEVHRLLLGGSLGRLVAIWVTLVCGREPAYYRESYWRGTWAGEGGSLLMNQAYHCVDLMVALGGRPRVLSCDTRIIKHGQVLETEDAVTATLSFANGALGSLNCTSATTQFWRSRIDVIGTEGSVTFDIDHPNRLHDHSLPKHVDAAPLMAAAEANDDVPGGIDYYGSSHNALIADFLGAIRERRSPRLDPLAALTTLEVITDLYARAKEGQRTFDAAS